MIGLFDDQPMFNAFELETAQMIALEHGRDYANEKDMQTAVASVKRWNQQRKAAGLALWF